MSSSSHCVFCASTIPFKSVDTIKEQQKVNFVLRNILELSSAKVTQLGGGRLQRDGLLHPQLQVQVCSSCEEEVEEVIWLTDELARLSSGLRNRIYETRQEEGEGLNSIWGQTRLEALIMMRAAGGNQHQLCDLNGSFSDLQENVESTGGGPSSSAEVKDEGETMDNSQEPSVISNASGQNQGEISEGKSDAESVNDSLFEEEEEVFPIDSENDNEQQLSSTKSTVLRRSERTRASASKTWGSTSNQQMELETSDEEESCYDGNRKQHVVSPLDPDKLKRQQPDGLYHCPFCPKKYKNRRSRNVHKQVHGSKFVCKVCNRRYTYAGGFRQHLSAYLCGGANESRTSVRAWRKFLK